MLALFHLLADLARRAVGRAARRALRLSALLALALFFFMLGLSGFAVAGFIVLARVMDPALVALLMGAACCLIAALLALIAQAGGRPPRNEAQDIDALIVAAGKTGTLHPLVLAVLVGLLAGSRKR